MTIENVTDACPVARRDQLTIRELPDETLVYDLDRQRMHCLNRTSALVWRHCDGHRDVTALAAVLRSVLNLPEAEATAATRLALEQLGRRNLLMTGPIEPLPEDRRADRREALRKLASLAASALPVVMTLRTPSIARADPYFECFTDAQCEQNVGKGSKCVPYGRHLSGRSCTPATKEPESESSPSQSCTRRCTYDQNGALIGSGVPTECSSCSAVCSPVGSPNSTTTAQGTC